MQVSDLPQPGATMSGDKEKMLVAEAKRGIAREEGKLREKTFPNQHPGICTSCGKWVAKEQGTWSPREKVLCEGCGSEILNAGP
jgi:hypothetical protein